MVDNRFEQTITPGSEQSERLLAALKPGYINVDEMDFESMLHLARELAGQINYYNHNNKKQGNWQPLFDGNEVVVMSLIHNIDRNQREWRAHQLLVLSDGFNEAVEFVFDHFAELDLWYQKLEFSESAYQLSLKISSVITRSLAQELQNLLGLTAGLGDKENTPWLKEIHNRVAQFSDIWQERSVGEDWPKVKNVQQLKQRLYSAFAATISAIAYLQNDIKDYIEQAQSHDRHDPSMGLFMAFLRLFSKAQQHLNGFTERHRDFYYRQMLYFSPLPAKPDTAYLCLTGQTGVPLPVIIEKGSRFVAGQDEAFKDLLYQSEQTLALSNIKAKQLLCLNLQRDPLVSPENNFNYVTGINRIGKQLGPDAEPEQPRSLPMFGANKSGRFDNTELARVGLAISAPILNLSQGHRQIEVKIALSEPYLISHPDHVLITEKSVVRAIFIELLQTNEALFEPSYFSEDAITQAQQVKRREAQADKLMAVLSETDFNDIFAASLSEQLSQLYKVFLLALLSLARSKDLVETIFGRIFSRHSLSLLPWLSQANIDLILQRFKSLFEAAGIKGKALEEKLDKDFKYLKAHKIRIFHELYGKTFDVRVSTATGWYQVKNCTVKPLDEQTHNSKCQYGLCFSVNLGPQVEALTAIDTSVHGSQYSGEFPVLELAIKEQANFFPYSIFRELLIDKLTLNVEVKGLSDLVAYNQQGRVDPSKPFYPLGNLPNEHSYLVFGNKEMAAKNLTELTLHLDWSQLPSGQSGFEAYYLGYPQGFGNDSFKAKVSTLSGGSWLPVKSPQGAEVQSLFREMANSKKLDNHQSIGVNVIGDFKAQQIDKRKPFEFSLQSRHGWFKLALIEPEGGFGHRDYAPLLSQTLVANTKRRKPLAIPNAPYTPQLNGLVLDYKASSEIDLSVAKSRQKAAEEKVIHLHPFGHEQVYPANSGQTEAKAFTLFPRYQQDGNLFIGFEGVRPEGVLTLFFHLDQRATLVRNGPSDIQWAMLVENHWQPLPDVAVIEDTTFGFLTSGIVTLKLPPGMTDNNTVLPSKLYWLKVSADVDLSQYGDCYSVSSHVIAAQRIDRLDQGNNRISMENLGLPIKSDQWKKQKTIAAVAKVEQKTYSFGGRAPESEQQMIIRASERLRHKGRAVTPWDYEHLILQEFDHIDKVKCFPHTIYGQPGPQPGHVLILVRRKVKYCHHDVCDYFRVASEQLMQIKRFAQSVSSSFVNIEVRNPDYETVQMRCSVKFSQNRQVGLTLERLSREFSDHICPWHSDSVNQGFGWAIQNNDLKAFIQRLDYVEGVTNFSLLHISEQQRDHKDYYQLQDSVAKAKQGDTLKPLYPWSILIPANHHFIEVLDSHKDIPAEITGIDELEVGFNFIVQKEQDEKPAKVATINRVVTDG